MHYFSSQFQLNQNNMKTTWKLIGMLINRDTKRRSSISKLIFDNKCHTDKNDICNKLNEHFLNVGQSLANLLPMIEEDLVKYINHSSPNSFMFRGICTYEVIDLIIKY